MNLENFKSLEEIEKTKTPIIKLKDANIVEIETDSSSYGGCETCDYGSEYTTEITFHYDDGSVDYLEISEMYDYVCSEMDLMNFFIGNIEALKDVTRNELNEMFESEDLKDKLSGSGW